MVKKAILRKGLVFERPWGGYNLYNRLRYNPNSWDIFYKCCIPKNKFKREKGDLWLTTMNSGKKKETVRKLKKRKKIKTGTTLTMMNGSKAINVGKRNKRKINDEKIHCN